MSIGGDLAKLLFPSRATSEEDHVYRWRVAVALLLWSNVMSTTLFVLLAFGTVQMLGFTGFATKAEAQEVQQIVKAIRVSQLENQLQGYRIQQCQAQMEGNQAALKAATENLREKGNLYRQLTGLAYVPESCDALLIVARPAR
jgi:hypothetical protein